MEKDPFSRYLYQRSLFQLNTGELHYMPILNGNQWWLLNRYLLPLDDLHSTFKSDETFSGSEEQKQNDHVVLSFWVTSFRKYSWTEHLKLSEEQNMFPELTVFDEFKALLVDNTPTYLTILFTVNFLHTLFSLLSIQQNIIFYNNLSDNTGISKFQAYSDVVFELIGLFYLMDNDTSILIIVLTCVEFLFKIWIALKICPFKFSFSSGFPFITRETVIKNEENRKTEESETKIIKYIMMIFTPLFLAYLGYSIINYPQGTRLYSFILEKTVAFIYIVGFANMFPQIYINYSLKSVNYMPWKALIYKFFNTIIDDLFAFAVKMPTLKRLSCFRDDVIFVIFLFQWWIYRKNKKRGIELFVKSEKKVEKELLAEKKESNKIKED
jgi:hypothetical protein